MFQVLIPAEFHEQHRQIVLEFARRGHEFGRDKWRQAIVAFDLLKNAAVLTDRGLLPFPVIYRQHVEEPYADDFIEALYLAARVDEASISRWATVARDVGPRLAQVGLLTISTSPVSMGSSAHGRWSSLCKRKCGRR